MNKEQIKERKNQAKFTFEVLVIMLVLGMIALFMGVF
jgi:hypothetical protein